MGSWRVAEWRGLPPPAAEGVRSDAVEVQGVALQDATTSSHEAREDLKGVERDLMRPTTRDAPRITSYLGIQCAHAHLSKENVYRGHQGQRVHPRKSAPRR